MEFKNLGLSNNVLKSIDLLGYTNPSKIQEAMIPKIIEGYDLIGQAQTGTGKTLAYAASILTKMNVDSNVVKAIVLVPTRELALQVEDEFVRLNTSSNFSILALFGGSSIEKQIDALKRGVDVVVGTPGRVMDLLRRKKLNIENLEFFVLDEADEMLNMGFLEDIESIFKVTNEKKQVLMLSATMPKEIKALALNYMKNYEHINIEATSKTAINVSQYYYLVNEKSRVEILCRVLDLKSSKKTIIFCQTKKECDELLSNLGLRGYSAEVMHGDITQDMRIKTLDRFKTGSFKVLIATDIAARGIHVDEIDLVINYRLPYEYETYIHRIGRTGRQDLTGEAISLVSHKEISIIERLAKFINTKIIKNEVPTKEEIITLKYQKILEEANKLENKDVAFTYVRDMNKSDLMTLSASLLTLLVNKELGSNLDKEIIVKEHKKAVRDGKTRVFITIGTKDNLKKGSLLDYIKSELKMKKDHFNNIEVLATYTFIDVDSNIVDEFMKKIKGKKFNNREIRVEKAKKQNN